VAQLVEALSYKSQRSRFRFPMVSLEFSIDINLQMAIWPWDLTDLSTRGKGGRCLRLTTLPLSCADCLEIWEPRYPGTLRPCPGIALPYLAWRRWVVRFRARPRNRLRRPNGRHSWSGRFSEIPCPCIYPVSIPRPRPARSLFTVSTELLMSDSKPCWKALTFEIC
jgi:hypothetical protein